MLYKIIREQDDTEKCVSMLIELRDTIKKYNNKENKIFIIFKLKEILSKLNNLKNELCISYNTLIQILQSKTTEIQEIYDTVHVTDIDTIKNKCLELRNNGLSYNKILEEIQKTFDKDITLYRVKQFIYKGNKN